MSTPAKIVLLATGLGLLVWLAKSQIKQWSDQFAVKVNAIGLPAVRAGVLSLPVAVNINNPTPVAIPVTDVNVLVYAKRQGNLIPIGSATSGPFTVPAGVSTKDFYPQVDLLATATGLDVKGSIVADITVNVKGFIIRERYEQPLLKVAA